MKKPQFIEIKKLYKENDIDKFVEVSFHSASRNYEYDRADGTKKKVTKRYRKTKYRLWDRDGIIRLSKVNK